MTRSSMSALLAACASSCVLCAPPALPLVPYPQNISFTGTGFTTLTNQTRVFYTPAVANASKAFADDVAAVFRLNLTLTLTNDTQCASPGAGNVAFCIGYVPPIPSPAQPFPPSTCNAGATVGVFLNNTNFVGEATTLANVGECCALCASTMECEYWQFLQDPAAPSGTCSSSTPSNCCLMMTSNASAVADPRFTSGTRATPATGSLAAVNGLRYDDASYTLSASVYSGIVITAVTQQGAQHGGVTLLQSMLPPNAVPSSVMAPAPAPLVAQPVPDMDIFDYPFRPMRGSQLDLSSIYYHNMTLLRGAVDSCRMSKCNTMVLHMGAEGWIGMVMPSVSAMNASWRQSNPIPGCVGACIFYTNEEITDLVAYAYSRGVGFLPVCTATPGFDAMINALTTKFNPNSTYADFVDETDHLGPSGFNGTSNPRYWSVMKVWFQRSYQLFGAGWPGGRMPSFHVGAVLGEGGMDDLDAYQCYLLLSEIDPNATMSFYDGNCASCNDADHPLYAVRDKCLVHFYTEDYSISPIQDYVSNGWPIISISWLPLYILGGSGPYTQAQTYDFNLFWTATSSSSTYDISFEAGPEADARVLGSIPSTWSMPVPDDVSYMRQRLPAAMEKTWQYRGYPVPPTGPESFDDWLKRWLPVDAALDAIMGPTPRLYECDQDSICKPNPFGNGTSYQQDCNQCNPGPNPPTPPNGYKIGGRIFLTSNSYNLSFPNVNGTVQGLAGADAACMAESAAYPKPAWVGNSTWKALLVTEAGCGPGGATPCRRGSITPGAGDGQIDWPVQPNAAYYAMGGAMLASLADAHGMLGDAYMSWEGINQACGMTTGFTTLPNGTCNSWRYTYDMASPTQYGLSIGWAAEPVSWIGNTVTYPCGDSPFFCVEQLPAHLYALH